MGTLYKALKKQNTIKRIYANNFETAIMKAYSNQDYIFFHNSELIDVKNRFRIFNYKGVKYITKEMSLNKAKIELKNSLKCASLLDNKKVNNFSIEVLRPKLYMINDKYYIVTPYKGNTLQEKLYINDTTTFLIEDLKKIVTIFKELGIEYLGLSPRNMVVSDNKIYLFDFESVKFLKKINYFNMLYRTNILVNWSYFFKEKDLIRILDLLQNEKKKSEPHLNNYEKNYKLIMGSKDNNFELRKKIMKVVLKAECSIENSTLEYCLLPMDMAAIIADLYDCNMDVIMDLVFYTIRNFNEDTYKKILYKFSTSIIQFWKNNYDLKTRMLPILLEVIDEASVNDFKEKDVSLLNYYLNKELEKFKIELRRKLYIIFKYVDVNFIDSRLDFDFLARYLLSFNK